jgi:hypothetical protein
MRHSFLLLVVLALLVPQRTARFNPRDQNYARLYHLRFRAAGGGFVDVLWRTSGTQTVELARERRLGAEVITRDGARSVVSTPRITLTVGEQPVYIRYR